MNRRAHSSQSHAAPKQRFRTDMFLDSHFTPTNDQLIVMNEMYNKFNKTQSRQKSRTYVPRNPATLMEFAPKRPVKIERRRHLRQCNSRQSYKEKSQYKGGRRTPTISNASKRVDEEKKALVQKRRHEQNEREMSRFNFSTFLKNRYGGGMQEMQQTVMSKVDLLPADVAQGNVPNWHHLSSGYRPSTTTTTAASAKRRPQRAKSVSSFGRQQNHLPSPPENRRNSSSMKLTHTTSREIGKECWNTKTSTQTKFNRKKHEMW